MKRSNVRKFETRFPPQCVGHFAAGDPACEAAPACAWAYTCLSFRDWCERVGVDPSAIVRESRRSIVGILAWEIARYRKDLPPIVGGEMRQTLDRFLEAIKDSLPCKMVLHPGRDFADVGELYVATWKGRAPGWYRLVAIRVKGGLLPAYDLTIARFVPPGSRFGPVTIEIRVDFEVIQKRFPHVVGYALRWISSAPGAKSGGNMRLGTTAVGVPFEHVEDFARLISQLIREHRIRSAVIKDGLIQIKRPPKGRYRWPKHDDDRRDPEEVPGEGGDRS